MIGSYMTDFACNTEMRYASEEKKYGGQEPLTFDARYRAAQLPLFAPNSPLAVLKDPSGRYKNGQRMASHSLVITIDGASLTESDAIQSLMKEMKSTSLGSKIAWDTEERRRNVLHVTLSGQIPFPFNDGIPQDTLDSLSKKNSFQFRLQGLFTGSFNTGRIYICLYPEMKNGQPASHEVCDVFGVTQNTLLLCGYLNLTEELTPGEALSLSQLCQRHAETIFDTQICKNIAIMKSHNDLVLNSQILHRIPLGS